jgi:hypothetical protein
MNFKLSLLAASGCLLLAATNANAQGYLDALRYSQLTTGTTARSLAIGGAAGSLGADYSAASVNPAGLGVYRQSELTFSPYLNFNNTNSEFIGEQTKDNNTAFKIGNVGLVLNNTNARKSGWKGLTFGLGVNKLADFNTKYTYQGINDQSSFSEVMAYHAQTRGVDEAVGPMGYLGYQGYLLTDEYRSIPYNNVIKNGGSVKQTNYMESKGAVNDYNISLAANYEDKLMLGASLGITSYRFIRTTEFVEADNTGNHNNDFDYFSFLEKLETTGVGVNGKFGAIYAPSPLFRFGLAVHTPTYASYTDYIDYNLVSRMEGLGNHDNVTPQNKYRSDYTITTPMRAIASATGFFGTKGFITADVEYVPYNTMRIRYEGTGVSEMERNENNYISNTFRGVVNARVGAEVRANNMVSLRAGGAYYANPYKSGAYDMGGDRVDLSVGVGFKLSKNANLDVTYMHSQQNSKELSYSFPVGDNVSPVPVFYDASIKNNRNMLAMTLGLKF